MMMSQDTDTSVSSDKDKDSSTTTPHHLNVDDGSSSSNTSTLRSSPVSLHPLSPTSRPQYGSLLSQLSSLQSDLESELSEEFNADTQLDVSSIKDICRYFLNEYIKVGEKWMDKHKEATIPDAVLIEMPLLAPALRVKMWKILLGCHNKDESLIDRWKQDQEQQQQLLSLSGGDSNDGAVPILQSEKKGDQPESIAEQELIKQDVSRTRPNDPRFLPSLRQSLQLLLSFYCKSRGVQYKQGLNEILTPLLILYTEHHQSLGTIYNIFYSLITKFLPSIFNDKEFENLRAICRSFHLLFRYFDPELALHVDAADVLPELYATPWFITLFARDLHVDLLYFLWDVYLIEDDPFFHYFVALALLIQQRQQLLQIESTALPIALRQLHLTSLLSLLSKARQLRAQTPSSVRQRLYELSFTMKQHQQEHVMHMEMQSYYESLLPCLRVPALEIVQQAYSDLTEDPNHPSSHTLLAAATLPSVAPATAAHTANGGHSLSMKYIVLDIRDKQQFDAGHLPCAIHVSPSILWDKERLDQLLSDEGVGGYGKMKGQHHFCIVGNEMRTYHSIAEKVKAQITAATLAAAASTDYTATIALPTFIRGVQDTTLESSEPQRMYLTPAEVRETEEAERKRFKKGAAPPLAQPVPNNRKGSSTSVSPQPTLPTPQNNSTTGATASVTSPSTIVNATSPAETTSAATSPLSYTFPATSPLMDPYTASFVRAFLHHGFPFVSVCDGAYPAVHDLVMKYKQERDKDNKKGGAAAATTNVLNALGLTHTTQAIELVDHQPSLCLCCQPNLYVKWREDKIKKQLEAERRAEKERSAQEKKQREEQERAAKAALKAQQAAEREAKFAKAAEEKAEKERLAKEAAEKERQRARDAGEAVPEAENSHTGAATTPSSSSTAVASASVVAAEKLQSLKKWWGGSKPPSSTNSSTPSPPTASSQSSTAASPSLSPSTTPGASFSARKGSKEDQHQLSHNNSHDAEHKSENKDQETEHTEGDDHAQGGSTAASLFSKWESQARALAKKLSDASPPSGSHSSTPSVAAPTTPLSERDRMTLEHVREKAAERAESMAVDLREWMKDPDIDLFAAHEVRRIAGSTQGLLIPRVLAVSNGYIISLRPDNSKYAVKERDRDVHSKEAASNAKKGGGLLERLSASIAAATTGAAHSATTPPTARPANTNATSSAGGTATPTKAATAPPASSAFSLAPVDESSLLLEQPEPGTDHADGSSHTPDRVLSPVTPPHSTTKPSAATTTPTTPPFTSSPHISLVHPTNEPFTITGSGMAFIHSKRRISELDKITSKKERPCLLTFHWKYNKYATPTPTTPDYTIANIGDNSTATLPPASPSSAAIGGSGSDSATRPVTIYVIDRPKECIELVKRRYAAAKAMSKKTVIDSITHNPQVLAFPNAHQHTHKEESETTAEEDEEEEDEEEEGGEEEQHTQQSHPSSSQDHARKSSTDSGAGELP